ncbi:MAG: hypothetical protein R2792_01585 [Saprospiraceae bacterium]
MRREWSCGGDGQPASFGNRSAFISRNGGIDWEYNGTPAFKNVSHLYRLVTFPAGVNGFTLEFDFEVDGETSFDYLLVSLAPEGLTGLDPVETNYDNINDTGTDNDRLKPPNIPPGRYGLKRAAYSSNTVIEIPQWLIGNCTQDIKKKTGVYLGK